MNTDPLDRFFLLFQNCHFHSYILIACDAKYFACLESFSSKSDCGMIEIFVTVSSVI